MLIPELRALIESGPLAHLSTVNPDGSPQVSIIWIGLDGDDIISGHMHDAVKLRNIRRDPRVAISLQAPIPPGTFLADNAVLYGTARVSEGGAAEVLHRLGRVYVAPDFDFPFAGPPEAGFVTRTKIERVTGHGPWAPRR